MQPPGQFPPPLYPPPLPPPDNQPSKIALAVACLTAGILLLIGGSCAVLGVPMIKPGSVDFWIGVAFVGIAAGCGFVAFLIVYKGVLRR